MRSTIEAINKRIIIKAIILITGVFIRLYHLFFIGFNLPYALGGLYLEFAKQIYKSGFLLPPFIHYYQADPIPFAYPPLAFYIQAFLIYQCRIPEFAVNNALPCIFAIISLLLFSRLITLISQRQNINLAALAFFALNPFIFEKNITGAGVAESLGTVAIIFLLIELYKLTTGDLSNKRAALTGLALGLSVLSSPGSALAAPLLTSIILVWQYFAKVSSRRQLISYTAIVLGTSAVICSYYLYNLIYVHNFIDILLNMRHQFAVAGSDANPFLAAVINLNHSKRFTLTSLMYFPLLVIGFAQLIREKNILWICATILFLFIPREGIWLYRITEGILYLKSLEFIASFTFLKKKVYWRYAVAAVLVFLCTNNVIVDTYDYLRHTKDFVFNTVSAEELQVMDFVRVNSKPDEPMVVITKDTVAEYFPHVTERTMLNSTWGSEFSRPVGNIRIDDEDLKSCHTLKCIDNLVQALDVKYNTYLVVWSEKKQGIKGDQPIQIIGQSQNYRIAKVEHQPTPNFWHSENTLQGTSNRSTNKVKSERADRHTSNSR